MIVEKTKTVSHAIKITREELRSMLKNEGIAVPDSAHISWYDYHGYYAALGDDKKPYLSITWTDK